MSEVPFGFVVYQAAVRSVSEAVETFLETGKSINTFRPDTALCGNLTWAAAWFARAHYAAVYGPNWLDDASVTDLYSTDVEIYAMHIRAITRQWHSENQLKHTSDTYPIAGETEFNRVHANIRDTVYAESMGETLNLTPIDFWSEPANLQRRLSLLMAHKIHAKVG